ncbi:hypothetical protein [Streptomyces sp. NPDC005799]|uniref:hypothetical protein n=1 Tax=Streptomyces sp. NPDC005799 TaxID=3154678 RepID=UPI0033FE27EF
MAVDQLPGQLREFANYLNGLLARLNQAGGWCAVFWQRDPDGMRACLDGREVPPWDVVEALLQDLVTERGPAAVAPELGRARALHAAALTAYDARPGGRDALGDRLDVMLREQRYAAERQAQLGRLLASATTREEADAFRLDLAWARDDHERATARCAELRSRMAELDRQLTGGRDTAMRRGRLAGAMYRVDGDRTRQGAHAGRPGEEGSAGAFADEGRGGGWGAQDAGFRQQRTAHDPRAAGGPESGYGPGTPSAREHLDPHTDAGYAPRPTGATRPVQPAPSPARRPTTATQHPASTFDRSATQSQASAFEPSAVQQPGAAVQAQTAGFEPSASRRPAPAFDSSPLRDAGPAVQQPASVFDRPAAQPSASAFDPSASARQAPAVQQAAPAFEHPASSAHPAPDFGHTASSTHSAPDFGHPGQSTRPGAAAEPPVRSTRQASTPQPSAPSDSAPAQEPPSRKQRKRRRGSARFAGMGEESAGVVVPPGGVEVPAAADGVGGRTPRGARFAGGVEETDEGAAEAAVEAVDAAAARDVGDAVERLVRLRAEGRSGEAHALLVEIAHWPAARIPLLAAELQRAGLGADWATLLWETASLPAEQLVGAADALTAAGRGGDGEQILRQGVARPAGEIGRAVLELAAEGRRREVRALLDAYVRVRTPEEAARSAEPDPAILVPLLLEAARGVSDERHWDLVHALRVAGLAT